ncbi:hypothetical protein F8M41_001001 [Gigaspora margarita]|uniref:Uncharacterized protein n=1 Tax=Gigaspora margarita TaxID=4874 RepID=A0A8H4AZE1_GIGMA|nr:hypothetical protein F8M41_001001 [Gigaspora margarita]
MVLSIHCQNNVMERKLKRDPFPKPQQPKGQAPKSPSSVTPLRPSPTLRPSTLQSSSTLQTSKETDAVPPPPPTIPTTLPVIDSSGIKSPAVNYNHVGLSLITGFMLYILLLLRS